MHIWCGFALKRNVVLVACDQIATMTRLCAVSPLVCCPKNPQIPTQNRWAVYMLHGAGDMEGKEEKGNNAKASSGICRNVHKRER